jgi:hypothetical protein
VLRCRAGCPDRHWFPHARCSPHCLLLCRASGAYSPCLYWLQPRGRKALHSPDFTSLGRSGTALQSRDPRELWASRVVHSLRDWRDTCLSPGLGLGRTVHSVKGQRSAIVHPATSAALLLDQGMPWRRPPRHRGVPKNQAILPALQYPRSSEGTIQPSEEI